MASPSGYTFPILNSDGTYSSTVVDMADMFVRKELFLNAGLWTWGYNLYGGLGNGTNINYSSPIQVGSLTNWKQLSIGGTNSVGSAQFVTAVKTDGTLWAWGADNFGQLGNGSIGTSLFYSSPIQVGALTNWKQVACGVSHVAAVKTDGTVWAWGTANYGQLGNGYIGSAVYYSSPIQIGSLTNWTQVVCGYNHTYIYNNIGNLYTCGYNGYGQLGTIVYGNFNQSSPVQVGALTNWKQVACGYMQTAAIKTDGTLWIFGYNTTGNLGNGTINNYSSPIQVGILTSWKQVAVGSQGKHSAAISDGYI